MAEGVCLHEEGVSALCLINAVVLRVIISPDFGDVENVRRVGVEVRRWAAVALAGGVHTFTQLLLLYFFT